MLNNIFNLPKSFIFINFLLFINYDFYPIPATLFVLYLVFSVNELNLTKYEKFIINLQVFLFLVFLRIIPAITNQFKSIWKNIFQENYIINGGIFEDLQIVLFSISCNKVDKNSIIKYDIKFTENNSTLFCPFDIPYGYVLKFLNINTSYVWITTLVLSAFTLLILYKIYLNISENKNGKDFILVSALFLSPPINFITERMNVDLIIFLILYLIYSKNKVNPFIKSLIISLISLIKFYPIILLFSEFVINFMNKKYKNSLTNLLFGILSLYYFFFYESNLNSVNFFIKPTESYRAFGMINDNLYLSQLFQIDAKAVTLIMFMLISFFMFLIKDISFQKINETDFHFLTLFLGFSFFINYDYRLIFLFILINSIINVKNKYFTSVILVFLFSSPSLLHSYEKFYKLVEMDEFYYFDFSFYLLIAIVVKCLMEYLINNEVRSYIFENVIGFIKMFKEKFLLFLSKDLGKK